MGVPQPQPPMNQQQGYALPPGAAPPMAGQPVQQQPAATVIVQGRINFGAHPARIECPNCHKTVQTTTESNASAMAWLIGIGLCLIGCWPCACIPCCCVDSLQT